MLLLMILSSESWRKIVGKLLRGRTKNRREIPMISKYSVFFVETRRINAIFMSKKFSVPLTSESVTSGQAGGVFRQLFLQWRKSVGAAIIDIRISPILYGLQQSYTLWKKNSLKREPMILHGNLAPLSIIRLRYFNCNVSQKSALQRQLTCL
jgi:hypothetical protein